MTLANHLGNLLAGFGSQISPPDLLSLPAGLVLALAPASRQLAHGSPTAVTGLCVNGSTSRQGGVDPLVRMGAGLNLHKSQPAYYL